jgi:hypothetical protein
MTEDEFWKLPWKQSIGTTYQFSSRVTSDTFTYEKYGFKAVIYYLLPDIVDLPIKEPTKVEVKPDNEYYWHNRKYKSIQDLLMDYNNDKL